MGAKTRLQIINEGIDDAGVEATSTLRTKAASWLQQFLDRQYTSWPWPFVQRKRSDLSLPAGTTSLTVGSGNSGITNRIHRIIAPIGVYNSAKTQKSLANIQDITDSPDEAQVNTTSERGLPSLFKVRSAGTDVLNAWKLIPYPIPGAAYLLSFDYLEVPAALTADGDIPVYPDDETMIKAVEARVLRSKNGVGDTAYVAAKDEMDSMCVSNRQRFGQVEGTNDRMKMSPKFFR